MLLPAVAGGQMGSPTLTDATVVARGSLRYRGQVEWTRYDAVFGANGKGIIPLGAALTMNVGVGTFPALDPAQAAVQSLARTPLTQLSVGRLTTSADSRIASVPVSVEYGLTRRIMLGLTVPIIQTRTVVAFQLNGRGDSSANVGINPAGFLLNASTFSANAQVTAALDAARAQLTLQRTTCAAAPASGACPAFNARLSEVDALIADAGAFAAAASDLYGVSMARPGAPFVPLAGGVMQKAIDTHLADLRAAFTSFGLNGGNSALVGAAGMAANAQLQKIVNDERYGIALDSIGTTGQLTVGDIELSATAQLFNSFSDSSPGGIKLRGSVAGLVRLATGHRARGTRTFDIGTGDGQTDIEVRGAVDVLVLDRLLTTVAATHTLQLGSVNFDRLPYAPDLIYLLAEPTPGSIKLGSMSAVRVNPRLLVTRGLMIGGLVTAAHRSADQVSGVGLAPSDAAFFGVPNPVNTWAGGLTISYSNLASRAGTGNVRFPAEVHFSHLETLGATAEGARKTSRDAIELRFYFRTVR